MQIYNFFPELSQKNKKPKSTALNLGFLLMYPDVSISLWGQSWRFSSPV